MRMLSLLATLLLATLVSALARSAQPLVRALPTAPVTLDPHFFLGTPEAALLKDMFEGLMVQNQQGEPVPGAAQSYQVSDDRRTWTFFIRQGLHWSDGSPLNAEDFLYSFRRLAHPDTEAHYRWYLDLAGVHNSDAIASGLISPDDLGVSAPDSHTLVITLDQPRSWFPALLTFPSFLPVSKRAIERCGSNWNNSPECAVSNGPYSLERRGERHILLKKNNSYREHQAVAIEQVQWQVIPSPLAQLVALERGELDITTELPRELTGITHAQPPQEYTTPLLATAFLQLNPADKILSNAQLRKALVYTLDRAAIWPASASRATTLVPPWTRGAANQQPVQLPQYERDILARQALAETPYNADNPLQLELLTAGSGSTDSTTASLVAQWRRLPGVVVDVVSVDWKEYFQRTQEGKYQMTLGGWLAAYNDPSAFLLLGGSASPSAVTYMGDEYDQSLRQAMSDPQPDHAARLYHQLETRLLDSYTLVPVSHMGGVRWLSQRVQGFSSSNPEGWMPSHRLRLSSEHSVN